MNMKVDGAYSFGNLTSLQKKNFSAWYEPTSQANFAYMTSVKYATEEEVRLYMTFRKFLIMTLQWLSGKLDWYFPLIELTFAINWLLTKFWG